jgi:hypothetical protein
VRIDEKDKNDGGSMNITSAQAGWPKVYDRQTAGAAVVTKTLDYMNGVMPSSAQAVPADRQTFGAAVVSKTLDYMNGPVFGKGDPVAQSYQFGKDVLGPAYSGVGSIIDMYS